MSASPLSEARGDCVQEAHVNPVYLAYSNLLLWPQQLQQTSSPHESHQMILREAWLSYHFGLRALVWPWLASGEPPSFDPLEAVATLLAQALEVCLGNQSIVPEAKLLIA
eukprot:CAMPEP_0169244892 /NCGR_PEP_ID=MMETSP1016-20121227/33893_1 /TAXON_ID=342587 /ORGANISM="Karlodinium micrum, Strain CCMP2283" /LENGTH=109 /DNA_ID=CAMNT_0009325335 /DNA_START=722 /DNA_END=1051 /DNA_ORIENTATION=-